MGNESDRSIYLTLSASKVLRIIHKRYKLTNPRGLLKDCNVGLVTVSKMDKYHWPRKETIIIFAGFASQETLRWDKTTLPPLLQVVAINVKPTLSPNIPIWRDLIKGCNIGLVFGLRNERLTRLKSISRGFRVGDHLALLLELLSRILQFHGIWLLSRVHLDVALLTHYTGLNTWELCSSLKHCTYKFSLLSQPFSAFLGICLAFTWHCFFMPQAFHHLFSLHTFGFAIQRLYNTITWFFTRPW